MRLSDDHVKRHFDRGFLIDEYVFTGEELQPVLDDFEVMVDGWADKLCKGRKIQGQRSNSVTSLRRGPLHSDPMAPVVTANLWRADREPNRRMGPIY